MPSPALSSPPPVPTGRTGGPTGASATRFRPEVQGLRALAVLLVLVYHLEPELLPGGYVGVDVFFVISGFLITSLLLREATEHGRVSLSRFYVRRVRRLLPAATLVLLVTGAVSLVVLPVTRLGDTAAQLLASALWVENLYLADQALDYLAAESPPSPVQHFWSLSVEEQFYLVWPLLFLGWALCRRRWRAGTGALTLVLAAVFAGSLTCSALMTASGDAGAYFWPVTRAWELAAGGLLAVLMARRALPERLRLPLGWLGLGAIVASALLYDSATPFPGYTALLPVLGSAAVIAAERPSGPAVSVPLSTRPARFFGDISYSLYLWHWPVIIVALELLDRDTLGPLGIVAAGGLSILLAWATKVCVEDPVARHGLVRTGRTALVMALSGIVMVALVAAVAWSRVDRVASVEFDPTVHVGPEALEDRATSSELPYPSPIDAEDDVPRTYDDDCQAGFDDADPSQWCEYGPDDATATVVITGDSHSLQWFPALEELAEERGWRLVVLSKSACAFTDVLVGRDGEPYDECLEWNRAAVDEILEIEPDLLFTSSSVKGRPYGIGDGGGDETRRVMAEGMAELWRDVTESGVPVLAVRDTPRVSTEVLECLAANTDDPTACDRPAAEALETDDPQELAVEEVEEAQIVDLTDRFCVEDTCAVVIGNVLVYRDSHHITETYARLLADDLGERMDQALSRTSHDPLP
ncbi:acyltransferase family protein [Nocardiopsis sp. MG754419]|uniref:acyltransferase family protein n=1 Tax=Nocardiopsis sp. MG754419 TaxID=2259865 RepID=UPI001BA7B841|nr:acyltransferase family protein [Nocardiopsis sp. MG754419]MBR8743344.1 acyltransferase [Nocardiopsis sp. MG754419]